MKPAKGWCETTTARSGRGSSSIRPVTNGPGDDPTPASLAIVLQDPAAPGSLLAPRLTDLASSSGWLAAGDLNADGRADFALSGLLGPDEFSVSVVFQDTGPGFNDIAVGI